MRSLPILLPFLLAAAACTSSSQSGTSRSATEQMLLSTAAERAADRLLLDLEPGTRAFVETAHFESYDRPYALGAIKDSLLRQGVQIVRDPAEADTIIELRSGALAIDQHATLVGLPSMELPVPLGSDSLSTPELALYKEATQQGVAKFAATAYAVEDGRLQGSTGPQYGYSHRTERVILLFVAWTNDDLRSREQRDPRETLVPESLDRWRN